MELGLKARICRALKWKEFPETSREFEKLKSFRTHDLDALLHLSGREQVVKAKHLAAWSAVIQWNPETRYQTPGSATQADADLMIKSTKELLAKL